MVISWSYNASVDPDSLYVRACLRGRACWKDGKWCKSCKSNNIDNNYRYLDATSDLTSGLTLGLQDVSGVIYMANAATQIVVEQTALTLGEIEQDRKSVV